MSLLVLMYHRAQAGEHGNAPEMLDRHFAHIAGRYRCVLPGEALEAGRVNVCLSFDDAYFDFYATAYPLLKKHDLRALLAVPPAVVAERAKSSYAARLTAPANFLHPNLKGEAFCTWTELHELAESGRVEIAAHGFSHCRLDETGCNLRNEIARPKALLSSRLGRPVNSFVFPYGRFSSAARQLVEQNYRHAFRIGGADNRTWENQLLYRVTADNLTSPDSVFTSSRLLGYRVRRTWNALRRR